MTCENVYIVQPLSDGTEQTAEELHAEAVALIESASTLTTA